MEKESLATEMLRELKAQSKRKDIIIVILIGVIFAMIVGFWIYEGQFETIDEKSQEITYSDNSVVTQTME